ncbi:Glucose/arabinose dehydrogenase, beta-propeller fold [Roseomonas rosea]|uniref:Glucose/arabinose dehydrogenase, beta-propeller fold n=1 Tax=Muricoccus roseus TaxID=198092 RepID=A0A1M6FEF9_9PROT|nr:PQQ-dependent sugar dehydrogenase [Roseomonas rosea]SHI96016.1 Glucose/arabinose dehydrogenase, beta-propeller fold [Roseomonas rosea]
MRGARLLALLLGIGSGVAGCAAPVSSQEVVRSERASFRVVEFATGLERPWGAAFLPDGRLLVTERPGRLRILGRDGAVSAPVPGVPEVVAQGQGGLLDVALAPDFATTRQVYFCLAGAAEGGALTRLASATFSADMARLEGVRTLLDAGPAQASGRNHFGCRIVFGRDGKLYLSTGDRYTDKERAQRLGDLAGKVLRLERDGRPAEGNPFIGRAGARPEVFTYGHRNPQGLAVNPATGSLIEVEFGARGGDEVNLLRAGANHGWPIVSYGTDYDGSPVGTGRASAPGIEEPLRHWTPAVSPSGGNFYAGDAFPGWRGNLFLAALRPSGLVRLTMEGDRVVGEERLLWNRTRFRQVLPGPDGLLYILTDEAQGRVLRLEPAN